MLVLVDCIGGMGPVRVMTGTVAAWILAGIRKRGRGRLIATTLIVCRWANQPLVAISVVTITRLSGYTPHQRHDHLYLGCSANRSLGRPKDTFLGASW